MVSIPSEEENLTYLTIIEVGHDMKNYQARSLYYQPKLKSKVLLVFF
jgi:hypothetical protein